LNNLITTNANSQRTIDSRIVADMVEKRHDNLMADIRGYAEHMRGALNIQVSDFFIESTYQSEQNKTLPCYLVTKQGCEMIANKLTGAKGVQFTAAYVARFNEMERAQQTALPAGDTDLIKAIASQDRAKAMLMNAQVRAYKTLMGSINDKALSPVAVQLFGLNAIEAITGQHIDYRPDIGKTYTCTEIAAEMGIPPQTLGRIATKHNVKTPEYGITALDKSPYSDKQVATFRYNEKGRAKLHEIFGNQRRLS
jgi:Rha family phage regulatory protein